MRVFRVRPRRGREERNADQNQHNFRGEPLAEMLDAECREMDENSGQVTRDSRRERLASYWEETIRTMRVVEFVIRMPADSRR